MNIMPVVICEMRLKNDDNDPPVFETILQDISITSDSNDCKTDRNMARTQK